MYNLVCTGCAERQFHILLDHRDRLRSSSRSNGQPAEALPSLAAADKVPKAPIPRPFPQLLHRSGGPFNAMMLGLKLMVQSFG
eukprot:s1061_g2.t1